MPLCVRFSFAAFLLVTAPHVPVTVARHSVVSAQLQYLSGSEDDITADVED